MGYPSDQGELRGCGQRDALLVNIEGPDPMRIEQNWLVRYPRIYFIATLQSNPIVNVAIHTETT